MSYWAEAMSDGSMRFREALSWGKTRMHSSAGHVCGKPKDIRANQNGACSSNAQDRHSMPGRGLEPLRISPPDPKSGASANFATLAIEFQIVDFRSSIAIEQHAMSRHAQALLHPPLPQGED